MSQFLSEKQDLFGGRFEMKSYFGKLRDVKTGVLVQSNSTAWEESELCLNRRGRELCVLVT